MGVRLTLSAMLVALAISPSASGTERTCHGVTDGRLFMPLPKWPGMSGFSAELFH
jgi:hypothetical protein